MPLPKPNKNEPQDKFISRCMGNPTMNEEYPDNEQRAGVCYTQWRNRNKKKIEDLVNKAIKDED